MTKWPSGYALSAGFPMVRPSALMQTETVLPEVFRDLDAELA